MTSIRAHSLQVILYDPTTADSIAFIGAKQPWPPSSIDALGKDEITSGDILATLAPLHLPIFYGDSLDYSTYEWLHDVAMILMDANVPTEYWSTIASSLLRGQAKASFDSDQRRRLWLETLEQRVPAVAYERRTWQDFRQAAQFPATGDIHRSAAPSKPAAAKDRQYEWITVEDLGLTPEAYEDYFRQRLLSFRASTMDEKDKLDTFRYRLYHSPSPSPIDFTRVFNSDAAARKHPLPDVIRRVRQQYPYPY